MAVSRWLLVTVLVAAVGCAKAKDNGGPPASQNEWREKKRLAEMRAKAEVIKEDLRRLQRELNAKDRQKSDSRGSGETTWRPHEEYLDDSKYKTLHTELFNIVETHNSILDQNPTWNTPRLDLKLEYVQ